MKGQADYEGLTPRSKRSELSAGKRETGRSLTFDNPPKADPADHPRSAEQAAALKAARRRVASLDEAVKRPGKERKTPVVSEPKKGEQETDPLHLDRPAGSFTVPDGLFSAGDVNNPEIRRRIRNRFVDKVTEIFFSDLSRTDLYDEDWFGRNLERDVKKIVKVLTELIDRGYLSTQARSVDFTDKVNRALNEARGVLRAALEKPGWFRRGNLKKAVRQVDQMLTELDPQRAREVCSGLVEAGRSGTRLARRSPY